MIDDEFFITQMRRLCSAFRRRVEIDFLFQYFLALKDLTETELAQLIRWAIMNVDKGFPTIATLRQHATAQGWYRLQPNSPPSNELVSIVCPECGGSSAISRNQLRLDATHGHSYQCINHDRWKCPGMISAQTVLEREDK
jgi:hypothetical protein